MSLFTDIDEVRAVVSTDLTNVELMEVVSREEQELIRRAGAHTSAITEVRPGKRKSIYLSRAVSSISSVSEYIYLGDTTAQTLVANTDYVVWEDQGRIERLDGLFGAKVTVVFTPSDDRDLRKQVLIELVRIALNQSNYSSEKVEGVEDSYSYTTAKDWGAAREQQYARLTMGML
jgi:hypothetical protein